MGGHPLPTESSHIPVLLATGYGTDGREVTHAGLGLTPLIMPDPIGAADWWANIQWVMERWIADNAGTHRVTHIVWEVLP